MRSQYLSNGQGGPYINQAQIPVTVTAYYKALLTDEAWESLRQSTPADGARLSEASAAMTSLCPSHFP